MTRLFERLDCTTAPLDFMRRKASLTLSSSFFGKSLSAKTCLA